jgi:hypothetical protein
MHKWLDGLERFLTIVRPKTYNWIARAVITSGILLIAESQLNFAQALVIATYEYFLGHSDILRQLIQGSPSPWLGVFLIVTGLTYHYFMSTGIEKINLLKAKDITLDLVLLNSDLAEYSNNTVSMRGKLVTLPSESDIPKYRGKTPNSPINNLITPIGLTGYMGGRDVPNPEFYKERAKLLSIWGGSELIHLKVNNPTEHIATGVRVELRIKKQSGLSATNTTKKFPSLPSEKSESLYDAPFLQHQNIHMDNYDIKFDDSHDYYIYVWDVDTLQANTKITSDTCIFLRTQNNCEIKVKVYCNEFKKPFEQEFLVTKAKVNLSVSTEDLQGPEKGFNKIMHDCIMDDYLKRYAKKAIEGYEHKHQELTP